MDEFDALFTEYFQFEFPGISKSFSNLGLFGLSDIQQKCQYPRLFSWKVHLKCGAVDWVTNGRIQSCMLFWRVLSTEKTEFCKYHSLLESSACDDADAKTNSYDLLEKSTSTMKLLIDTCEGRVKHVVLKKYEFKNWVRSKLEAPFAVSGLSGIQGTE